MRDEVKDEFDRDIPYPAAGYHADEARFQRAAALYVLGDKGPPANLDWLVGKAKLLTAPNAQKGFIIRWEETAGALGFNVAIGSSNWGYVYDEKSWASMVKRIGGVFKNLRLD